MTSPATVPAAIVFRPSGAGQGPDVLRPVPSRRTPRAWLRDLRPCRSCRPGADAGAVTTMAIRRAVDGRPAERPWLGPLLRPASVAVVGAMRRHGSVGYETVQAL